MVAELEGFSLFGGRRSRRAGRRSRRAGARRWRGGKGSTSPTTGGPAGYPDLALEAGGVGFGICPPGQPLPRVAAISNGLSCGTVRGGRRSRRAGRKSRRGGRKSRRGGCGCNAGLIGGRKRKGRKSHRKGRKSHRKGRKSHRRSRR